MIKPELSQPSSPSRFDYVSGFFYRLIQRGTLNRTIIK
jgi:hypothetical protein